MKRCLIICISVSHGNTLKVAEAMAEAVGGEILAPGEIGTGPVVVDLEKFREYDLIGFGSGIYNGSHHSGLIRIVEEMPVLKGGKAFIFSTSSAGEITAHRELRLKLMEKRMVILGEFACPGKDDYGPAGMLKRLNLTVHRDRPGIEDLEQAREFAVGFKNKVSP